MGGGGGSSWSCLMTMITEKTDVFLFCFFSSSQISLVLLRVMNIKSALACLDTRLVRSFGGIIRLRSPELQKMPKKRTSAWKIPSAGKLSGYSCVDECYTCASNADKMNLWFQNLRWQALLHHSEQHPSGRLLKPFTCHFLRRGY